VLATTLHVVAKRVRDPKLQAAITSAMKEIVDRSGSQQEAARRIGVGQSRVSKVLSAKEIVAVDTLVRMRRVLGWSWETLLGQSDAAAEELRRLSLDAVVARFPQRWRPGIVRAAAEREGIPSGGWVDVLDEMQRALDGEPPPPSSSSPEHEALRGATSGALTRLTSASTPKPKRPTKKARR
jgi:hypothetical protein